jgi:hypothetical protein
MAAILFPIHFVAALLALLLTYNWMTLPTSLDLPTTSVVIESPAVSVSRRREIVSISSPDHEYEVACSTVASLCLEIKRGEVQRLEVWPVSAGLLGGDWLAQAKLEGRLLIALEEQRAQFRRMANFFNAAAAMAWALTMGLGYVLYRPRRSAASSVLQDRAAGDPGREMHDGSG